MENYKQFYHILFNAITDALEQMNAQAYQQACARLISAQQQTEQLYIEQEENT